MSTNAEQRFSGQLADEYDLITLAYPDFESFQASMIASIRAHIGARQERASQHERDPQEKRASQDERDPRPVVIYEIGTGNGFTTRLLCDLPLHGGSILTVDNDPQMVAQARTELAQPATGRLEVIENDALSWLQTRPAASADVVCSAFTLHNLERSYREQVEYEIARVLVPGGLFANADKYAPDGQERFDALAYQVERFFDAFLAEGRTDLLRKWVVHNIADQSPRYVMRASEAIPRMEELGFHAVQIGNRAHMQAVLTAIRTGASHSPPDR